MSTCTLTMLDSYGDGWNGDVWTGFNQEYTLEAPTPPYYPGQTQVVTFQVVIPPPAPPFIAPPPSAPSTYMELQVTSGTWPSEISFTLACNNELVVSGGAPFPPTVFALAVGVNCTLTMMDVYADGWNGLCYAGIASTTLETGARRSTTLPFPFLREFPTSTTLFSAAIQGRTALANRVITSEASVTAVQRLRPWVSTTPLLLTTIQYLMRRRISHRAHYYAGSLRSIRPARTQAIARNTCMPLLAIRTTTTAIDVHQHFCEWRYLCQRNQLDPHVQ